MKLAAVVIAVLACSGMLAAQNRLPSPAPSSYQAPRLPGTKHPDLNGLWQALNTAYWDIQDHSAQPAPVLAMAGGPVSRRKTPETGREESQTGSRLDRHRSAVRRSAQVPLATRRARPHAAGERASAADRPRSTSRPDPGRAPSLRHLGARQGWWRAPLAAPR